MNDSINTINDALVEKYKILQEIQENQFRILKEKYEAEVKLNILQIQNESVSKILSELNTKRDALKQASDENKIKEPENTDRKLVTKSAFNMQPTITNK